MNLLHCAIADPELDDNDLDYICPQYSRTNMTQDEMKLRAILIGERKPSKEAKLYTSVTLRHAIGEGPFAHIGNRFGLEEGYSLEQLRQSIFSAYKPRLDDQIFLSSVATYHRFPTYKQHAISCQVLGSQVTVHHETYGSNTGLVDSPIAIAGFPQAATVTVQATDGVYTGYWATQPSISIGSIAETLAVEGLLFLNSLANSQGRIFSDETHMLIECVKTSPVPMDRVCAACLILANAVFVRHGFN
jgi:hypothetical protein